jgi:hypothetical protein
MNTKRYKLPLAILALLLFSSGLATQSQAGVITANGIQWELTSSATPEVDSTGTFTLAATLNPGWDGDNTAWLGAFSLQNFGSGVAINGGVISSDGGLWDWTNEGMAAKGCKTNGTDDALCVYLAASLPGSGNVDEAALGGASPNTGDPFSFTFTVTADNPFPEFLHLKVNWWEEVCKTKQGVTTCDGWKKTESLISEGISYNPDSPDTDPNPDPDPVPIPGTLLLLGLGLASLGASRRRG